MADFTPTNAFAQVPNSGVKTALITDFDNLLTEIDTAQAAGAFSSIVARQLKDQIVDVAETVAANMSTFTTTTTTTTA